MTQSENGAFSSRADDGTGRTLQSHIDDKHLNPHPQYALGTSLSAYALTSSLSAYALTSSLSAYRLTSTPIGQSDIASGQRLFYICTSGTRPGSPTAGELIFETDTKRHWLYDGSAWTFVSGPTPRCKMHSNGGFSCVNAATGLVSLGTGAGNGVEDYDTDNIHDMNSNKSRFTIPTGFSGVWRFEYQFGFAANATGLRAAWFEYNSNGASGTTRFGAVTCPPITTGQDTSLNGGVTIPLSAGDYMELYYFQNSGISLTAWANGWDYVSCFYLGPL